MPHRHPLATLIAASLATAATFLTLTACGGSEEDSKNDKGSKTSDSAPAKGQEEPQKEKRATAAQLSLAGSEVAGYSIRKPSTDYVFAKSRDNIKLSKPVCAPLGHAMSQFPVGTPAPQDDQVRVHIAEAKKFSGVFTYITIATYAPGKAQAALSDMKKAVGACKDGFTAKGDKQSNPYDSIAPETPGTPDTVPTKTADDSLAFRATAKYQGHTHTFHTQATRHGDTLAIYFSTDGSAFTESRPGDGKLFPAVVKAQEKKLG
ncbi:hypothetical protein ACQB60_26395 [Actinomycetota bacterium Odt1-20B]